MLVFSPSALEFAAAVCGCFYAGAIALPFPFRPRQRGAAHLRSIVDTARPSALLTDTPDAMGRDIVPEQVHRLAIASAGEPAGAVPVVGPDAIAFE